MSDYYECPNCGGHHEPRSCDGGRARDEERARRERVIETARDMMPDCYRAALAHDVTSSEAMVRDAFRCAEDFESAAEKYRKDGAL